PSDEALFQELRAKRREIADAEHVAAFIVLHDKTLRELAARRPATLNELTCIPGMGAAKIAKYGQAFVDVITAFVEPP
ncbi:MAG: HRDC domain-containing protein, partial [Actinomycetales bacterium]